MTGSGSSKQIARSTKNVVGYLATRGRRIPLEGRFHGPTFRNWSQVLTHTPDHIERLRTDVKHLFPGEPIESVAAGAKYLKTIL